MRTLTIACAVLALSGCVFEDRCVGGASRDEAGRCTRGQSDAGADAGSDAGRDASAEPDAEAGTMNDGGTDGGTDAGTDAGPPPTIVDLAVGAAHACVVDSEGGLTCWGSNFLGQLATGDIAPQAAPRRIDLGAAVTAVAGTCLHACAQTSEPALHCWGSNGDGQTGNGATSPSVTTPHRIDTLGTSRHLAASFANTCFTDVTFSTRCWGRNDEGQLAIGMASTTGTAAPGAPARSTTGTLDEVIRTAVADRHTCFLTFDGDLLCAGRNNEGELGTADPTSVVVGTSVPGMINVTSVAASANHTCAVQEGDVYCWGANSVGEVLPGGADPVLAPTQVTGIGPATQVATGDGHTCALLETGEVACWGTRAHGALGDGAPASETSVTAPVMVTGLTDVVRVESGFLYLMCALTDSGDLYCWGEDAGAFLAGRSSDQTVFLDGESIHTAPVLVDPLL